MTAIISAAISKGNKIPVDAFSPNTNAKITTISALNPLTPALAIPSINTARAKAVH